MKISISELKLLPKQKLNITFKESLEDIDAVKPVIGDLILAYSGSGLHLSGTVQTLLKLSCHRCLQPYFQSLIVDIDERFAVQSDIYKPGQKERELNKDDFVEYLSDKGELDISDVVYQAVTLATPTSCLCSGECPGPAYNLASAEATEQNADLLASSNNSPDKANQVDPRWENLKRLFAKEE